MAIQIIKHGQKRLITTCPNCECEFSFLESDMKDYGNQIDWYETINCPECHHRITWWYGEKSGRTAKTINQPYN